MTLKEVSVPLCLLLLKSLGPLWDNISINIQTCLFKSSRLLNVVLFSSFSNFIGFVPKFATFSLSQFMLCKSE